jgi:hypothetical protein
MQILAAVDFSGASSRRILAIGAFIGNYQGGRMCIPKIVLDWLNYLLKNSAIYSMVIGNRMDKLDAMQEKHF